MLCIYFPLPPVIRVMGADAVVNVRYASANVMQGAAEVMTYGTAVKFV